MMSLEKAALYVLAMGYLLMYQNNSSPEKQI